MFSGIVEEAGRIVSIDPTARSIGLVVEAARIARGLGIGESVAVNGCCLTLIRMARKGTRARLYFDLLAETWEKTSFATVGVGGLVNLERSLRLQDRLGGHFVTGHIDGTGRITRWEKSGQDWVLEVRPPSALMPYFLYKGSVAIDGISLTVADVFAKDLRVWIIPHTLEVTHLQERKVGDRVNLEADLIGKYVERLLSTRTWPRSSDQGARRATRGKG